MIVCGPFGLKNMTKQSLYLKYRPSRFADLIGQDHIKTTLGNALKSGRTSHSYLFTGPRGTGKTSAARLLAKAINCTALEDGEPCNKCDICQEINDGRLIDLVEIDAASNRGIDEVRDLKEKINFAPTRAKAKVYIIDEVHMMTKEAFNALLKTLEEPPEHSYFILATTEAHKIPATIISRCQRFDFRRLRDEYLIQKLSEIAKAENIGFDENALALIAQYVDGGMRDAIVLLDQLASDGEITLSNVRDVLGVSDSGILEELYKALTQKNINSGFEILDRIHADGGDLRQFCGQFIDALRQKMLIAVGSNDRDKAFELIDMIEKFQEAQESFKSGIPQLALEIAVVKIVGGQNIIMTPAVKSEVVKHEAVKAPATMASNAPMEIQESAPQEHRQHQTILTLEAVKHHWPEIIEKIKTPTLRMSVKSAVPVQVKGVEIILEFATSFHLEKVFESANRHELEAMIQSVLGSAVKLTGVVGQGKPIKEEVIVPEEKAKDLAELDRMDRKGEDMVDEALDIFGGEVVG